MADTQNEQSVPITVIKQNKNKQHMSWWFRNTHFWKLYDMMPINIAADGLFRSMKNTKNKNFDDVFSSFQINPVYRYTTEQNVWGWHQSVSHYHIQNYHI